MSDRNVDLGDMKSRDVGNMISRKLVELGKEEAVRYSPDGYVDFGNLPSRTLPEIGKQVVANKINQEHDQLKIK